MKVRQARFEIHRSQKIAAALLLAFLLQVLWLAVHLPLSLAETRNVLAGEALWSSRRLLSNGSPLIPGDSVLTLRCAGLLPSLAKKWQGRALEFSIYAAPNRWLVRLPFALFGLWLGGALWWVARRLFSDFGGYIALALYCFSPPMLMASATVNSAILAAWGLFGLVFTAIGVAHTLYAPARKWRPRILLLGAAIGLTAAANVSAASIGLIFATIFVLYLAPGRRLVSLAVLAISAALGAVVFLSCFAFNMRDLHGSAVLRTSGLVEFTAERARAFLIVPGGMLEAFAFLVCVLVFLLWKRPRYFGNAAPLIVACLLTWWPGELVSGASILWSLPFAFVFIGGVYADLLEPRFFAGRFQKLVATTAFVLLGAILVMALAVVARA
jgi:hypothetical protein